MTTPVTTGKDYYFRSTETLQGFNQEAANAINALACRVLALEKHARAANSVTTEPSDGRTTLQLTETPVHPDADLTAKINAMMDTMLVPPGKIAEWSVTLPLPVVHHVYAIVEETLKFVETSDEVDMDLDLKERFLQQLRAILGALKPYLPDTSQIPEYVRDLVTRQVSKFIQERL